MRVQQNVYQLDVKSALCVTNINVVDIL